MKRHEKAWNGHEWTYLIRTLFAHHRIHLKLGRCDKKRLYCYTGRLCVCDGAVSRLTISVYSLAFSHRPSVARIVPEVLRGSWQKQLASRRHTTSMWSPSAAHCSVAKHVVCLLQAVLGGEPFALLSWSKMSSSVLLSSCTASGRERKESSKETSWMWHAGAKSVSKRSSRATWNCCGTLRLVRAMQPADQAEYWGVRTGFSVLLACRQTAQTSRDRNLRAPQKWKPSVEDQMCQPRSLVTYCSWNAFAPNTTRCVLQTASARFTRSMSGLRKDCERSEIINLLGTNFLEYALFRPDWNSLYNPWASSRTPRTGMMVNSSKTKWEFSTCILLNLS